MQIEFTRSFHHGHHQYRPGDRVDLPQAVAELAIALGAAGLPQAAASPEAVKIPLKKATKKP